VKDEERIADAKRWASKAMPDGEPRGSYCFHSENVHTIFIHGDEEILRNLDVMPVWGKTEDSAWLDLAANLERIREGL
jgi:hypothetical protein